jgi:hypothetical protein
MQRFLEVNPSSALEFFKVFDRYGTSNTTGYNWSHLSEAVRGSEKSVVATLTVPAGKVIDIQQVVGYCGQVTLRTEVFRNVERLPPKVEGCLPEEITERVYSCDAIEKEVYVQKIWQYLICLLFSF